MKIIVERLSFRGVYYNYYIFWPSLMQDPLNGAHAPLYLTKDAFTGQLWVSIINKGVPSGADFNEDAASLVGKKLIELGTKAKSPKFRKITL